MSKRTITTPSTIHIVEILLLEGEASTGIDVLLGGVKLSFSVINVDYITSKIAEFVSNDGGGIFFVRGNLV